MIDKTISIDFYSTLSAASLKSIPLLQSEIILIRDGYLVIGRENVFDFAINKKIIPFIAHLLCKLNIDADYWNKFHEKFVHRNRIILDVLDKIFSDFDLYSVNKVFLYENFGALLCSDSCIGCFASSDVDIYADVAQSKRIATVLSEHNFSPKGQDHTNNTVKVEYFNPNLFEKGFGINVMWKPLSRTKIPFKMDTENFINWDDLRIYKDTKIKIPDQSTLMYLCLLHISVHSFYRSPALRLYVDADLIAMRNPEWNKISAFALRDKTEVRTYTASILLHRLLGTPVPIDLIKTAIKKHKKINLILKFVLSNDFASLKKEPSALIVLFIEILSSDYSWGKASWHILFPESKWIREYYLYNGGSIVSGYFKHIINLY
jgi:hypothetical protein